MRPLRPHLHSLVGFLLAVLLYGLALYLPALKFNAEKQPTVGWVTLLTGVLLLVDWLGTLLRQPLSVEAWINVALMNLAVAPNALVWAGWACLLLRRYRAAWPVVLLLVSWQFSGSPMTSPSWGMSRAILIGCLIASMATLIVSGLLGEWQNRTITGAENPPTA